MPEQVQRYGDGSQMPLPASEETAQPNAMKRLLYLLMPSFGQKNEDVNLPLSAESQRDPRLPPAEGLRAIQEGYERLKSLGAPQGAMQALQQK